MSTTEKAAEIIYHKVVEGGLAAYDQVHSPEYRETNKTGTYEFFDSLNAEQRNLFRQVVQRIITDTAFHTIGLLSGELEPNSEEGPDHAFKVFCGETRMDELQAAFYETQERQLGIAKMRKPTF